MIFSAYTLYSSSRASIPAQHAISATVAYGRIHLERGYRKDSYEASSGTVLRRYEEEILTLPAQSGHPRHSFMTDSSRPVFPI
jgi:hypothetical protein